MVLWPTAAPDCFSEEATEDIRRMFCRTAPLLERRRERVAADTSMVDVDIYLDKDSSVTWNGSGGAVSCYCKIVLVLAR